VSTPYYKPTAPLTVTERAGIRTFDDANIQKAIDRAIAEAESSTQFAGHKLMTVAHADLNGMSLSAVVKLGDSWSVMAAAYKPWSGPLAAEAKVAWSPF
jgi:hypothetical protein